jgi:hypothetical protein
MKRTTTPLRAEVIPACITEPNDATHRIVAVTEDGVDVRTVALLGGNCAQGNATLFAAAGDMLTELRHMVRWHDQLKPDDISRARAAIAKAEGRPS